MKRQKIRKTLIIISFFLFPITIYYLSPALVIMGAAEGIANGSLVVFALLFIFSLFFGRAFCSWICPAGGLQECCMLASDKKARGGKRNYIKYFIWVPWIAIIIFVIISSGGYRAIDIFYQTNCGLSVTDLRALIIYYFFLTLIVVMAFIGGRRSACHYICWMAPFMIIGTKIKNGLKYPSLRLSADPQKCIKCGQCTKRCQMSLNVEEMVQKNKMTNPECILCGECADICPKKAICMKIGK